jgi:hypothetical protein
MISSIVPDFLASLVTLGTLISLKIYIKITSLCDLTDPSNYFVTISVILAASVLMNLAARIIILIGPDEDSTCGEYHLMLRVGYECLGVLLPFGFLAVVDLFAPPPMEELTPEVNFGITSLVDTDN